jgi:hypothetical protein
MARQEAAPVKEPQFLDADGELDLDALKAAVGPELYEAIIRGVLTLCDAQEAAEREMAAQQK